MSASEWPLRPSFRFTEPVPCAECERCGFAFDASHTDDTPEGGYSCPICELTALRARASQLENTLSAQSLMLEQSLRALRDVQRQAVEGQKRDEERIQWARRASLGVEEELAALRIATPKCTCIVARALHERGCPAAFPATTDDASNEVRAMSKTAAGSFLAFEQRLPANPPTQDVYEHAGGALAMIRSLEARIRTLTRCTCGEELSRGTCRYCDNDD